MSISPAKKVSSVSASASKAGKTVFANNHSQFVENIDTTNNVLVRDDNENSGGHQQQPSSPKTPPTDFNSATPDISTSIEALALSGIFEDEENTSSANNHKVGVYNNNQSIIKDEEVERTGRNYLKHFYEKNEHFIDVDEFV